MMPFMIVNEQRWTKCADLSRTRELVGGLKGEVAKKPRSYKAGVSSEEKFAGLGIERSSRQ
jgi:hypothetical protein